MIPGQVFGKDPAKKPYIIVKARSDGRVVLNPQTRKTERTVPIVEIEIPISTFHLSMIAPMAK